jgi:hypothetical protein
MLSDQRESKQHAVSDFPSADWQPPRIRGKIDCIRPPVTENALSSGATRIGIATCS